MRIQGQFSELGKPLGLLIKKEINEDGLRTSKGYKDISLLKSVSYSSWLDERNTLLISWIMGLSGAEIRNENEKKLNTVTHAVEHIYYARNLNIITPFAFKRNLITYSLTHSKTAVKLCGNWESSGSYATVTDTLLQQGDELKCPTDADVINTIDNNQKVGKCGRRIKEGSKVAISVCTTVGHIKPNPECFFTERTTVCPRKLVRKTWIK